MPDQPAESKQRRPAFVAFASLAAIAGAFYLYAGRRMWFFLDDWEFLVERRAGDMGDLFRPHNEHWVTLPVLAYRFLWWAFGIGSYRPFQVLVVSLHLAVAFLLRAVMRRAGVRPWIATVAAGVFVLFGAGYQDIISAFQISFVGALFFGLAHLLLADHDGGLSRGDWLGLLAGLAALMCSGIGVTMVAAVGIAVLIRRGWRLALFHTVPLAAIYLVWWTRIGDTQTTQRAGYGDVLRFAVRSTVHTFGELGGLPGVGLLLAVLLVAGLVVAFRGRYRDTWRQSLAAPIALLAGCALFLLMTGVGRAGLLRVTDTPSRYEHLAVAMILPALAVAADAVMRLRRWLTVPVVLLLVLGVPGSLHTLTKYTDSPAVTALPLYRRMMLTVPRIPAAQEVSRGVYPERTAGYRVTLGWLLDGAASGRIPSPGALDPNEVATDTVRVSVQQLLTPIPLGRCRPVGRGVVVNLDQGQTVWLRGEILPVRLGPANGPVPGVYPIMINPIFGRTLVATRPIAFSVTAKAGSDTRVCGSRAVASRFEPMSEIVG